MSNKMTLREADGRPVDKTPIEELTTSTQKRGHQLYNYTPIDEYTSEDIRFMIGQKWGLQYFIKPAIDLLEDDIFLDTEYYEGDLLCSLLRLSSEVWDEYPVEKQLFNNLLIQNIEKIIKHDLTDSDEIRREIKTLALEFIDKATL